MSCCILVSYMMSIKAKIVELLRLPGVLSEESITKMVAPRAMSVYTTALTHSSIDSEHNFQSHEFIGDSSINMGTTTYIRKRFPKVIDIRWLTRIKQLLVSTKYFQGLAEKYGLMDVFVIKEGVYEALSPKDKASLMDDVFEAAMGAIYNVATMIFQKGFGHLLVYTIITTMFDTLTIPLDWNAFMDPVSRIKEVYDKTPDKESRGIQWKEGVSYKFFRQKDTGKYACAIYFPHFDNNHRENRIVNVYGDTEEEALIIAANSALRRRDVFGDVLNDYPDPYVYKKKAQHTHIERPKRISQYESTHLPPPVIEEVGEVHERPHRDLQIPGYLVEYIHSLLKSMPISEYNISKLLNKRYVIRLLMSCITTCIEPEIEGFNKIATFESISLFDAIASEYAIAKHGYTREGILTKEKQDVLGVRNFSKIIPKDFVDVVNSIQQDNKDIYIVPGISEKRIASIFKAFISELRNIIDDICDVLGIGYVIVSEYIHSLFTSNAGSFERIDAKSKLNVLFISKGWGKISEDKGTMEYTTVKTSPEGARIETHKHIIRIFGYPTGSNKTLLGEGEGNDKITAEQDASKKALVTLKRYKIGRGLDVREPPKTLLGGSKRGGVRVFGDDEDIPPSRLSKPSTSGTSVRVFE